MVSEYPINPAPMPRSRAPPSAAYRHLLPDTNRPAMRAITPMIKAGSFAVHFMPALLGHEKPRDQRIPNIFSYAPHQSRPAPWSSGIPRPQDSIFQPAGYHR